jgi:hypothetical protein
VAVTVYVDLSAKLEQWTQASAIAKANDEYCRVYFVPSKVKQLARQRIKELYGATTVQYRLMAVLVYLVVREPLMTVDYIVIDKDYAGEKAEGTIKNILLDLVRKDRPETTAGMIRFQNVNGSRADRVAKQAYDGKIQPDRILKFREIAKFLRK